MKQLDKENFSEENVNDPQGEYRADKDFTTLECRKKAGLVKLFFYNEILTKLPAEEKYHFGGQIREASISTTANIAEGYGRFHYKESIQFYRISRGSLYELKDHLISCLNFGYVQNNLFERGKDLIEDAKISLNGYIHYIQKRIC
jgi:four helix bundle protein